MGFEKGHKIKGGGRKKGAKNKNPGQKKAGDLSLDTYYTKNANKFKKYKKKGISYLDPEVVDYYINNDLDLTELLEDGD